LRSRFLLTNIGNETAELTFTHKNQKVLFGIFDLNNTEVFKNPFHGSDGR